VGTGSREESASTQNGPRQGFTSGILIQTTAAIAVPISAMTAIAP
jgi:hypothetical protein